MTGAKQRSKWFKEGATPQVEPQEMADAPTEMFASRTAGEMFEMFDKDGSGMINREEFDPGQRHWLCTDRGDRSGVELKSGVLRGGDRRVLL